MHASSDLKPRVSRRTRRSPPQCCDGTRSPGDASTWTRELFASVDAKDTEAFLGFLTEDARFRFGNAASVNGREAIRAAVGGFFASIGACAHGVDDVWTARGHVICRGTVSYTRHDGRVVTVPFCNVLALAGGRIADYCVYIDQTPLIAP